MLNKNFVFTLSFILISISGFTHKLKGVLVDNDNVPVEGVSIVNKTTGGYAFSNVSGYFELDDISVADVIIISGLGYVNQEISIVDYQLILL